MSLQVELLLRIHHRNLVCLIGYCIEDNNMALVLEYMAQGNLGKALSGAQIIYSDQVIDIIIQTTLLTKLSSLSTAEDTTVFLSWTQRLRIALDIAQGYS